MEGPVQLRYLCVASLALSTAAISQTATFTPAQRAEGEADVAKAGKLLADNVRDTTSAKFRNVFLQKTIGRDGGEHVSLCGEVNSKNGYGGMSGFHKFILVGDQVLVGGAGQILNADEICDAHAVIDTRDYSPELRKAFDANAGQ
jgi:hypothetical protein